MPKIKINEVPMTIVIDKQGVDYGYSIWPIKTINTNR
jgi:hypothetical protein